LPYPSGWPSARFLQVVHEARRSFAGVLRRTPLEPSEELGRLLGVPVYLKLELLQVTGSFKARGALLRLSALENPATGVVTCSAGNHGWAVAWAAARLHIRATVFLPSSADPAKTDAIRRLGAEVVIPGPAGFDEVEPIAVEFARDSGRPYLSAFDDDWVMAGNGGTLAAEIVDELPAARTFVVPVGGGGLAAGFVRFLKGSRRPFTLVACQHQESPSLVLSLERGQAVTRMPAVETWAGGIEGGIGRRTFSHLRGAVNRVSLASEGELREAVVWLLSHHHYLMEPSAAAPVAACLTGRLGQVPGPAVLVLTGRNFALDRLRTLLGTR
jgi:threonine dehydratase